MAALQLLLLFVVRWESFLDNIGNTAQSLCDNFARYCHKKVGTFLNYKMLNYILRDVNFNLQIYLQEIIEDELNTPDYSAVYTNNIIKCYIELMNQIGNKLPFDDVKGYILYNNFSEQ